MRILLASVVLAITSSGCSRWMSVAPRDPRVRYTGRVDLADPSGPRFSFTGSAVAVRVDSRALRIHLLDLPRPWEGTGGLEPNHYELTIDGKSAGVVVAKERGGRSTVDLALPPGEHVVELFKRTEPAVGQGQVLGIELPEGARLLAAPGRPDRRVEVIGDSSTTGYGNAGDGPDCPFSAATEDGYRSYAATAGRMLGAELHIVAWHGRGVVRNYDLGSSGTIPQLYERTLPEMAGSRWDFSRWTPHVVVIAAGANDFLHPGLDIAAFERGYLDLLAQVRRRYPEAFILCAYPRITDEWPVGARHGTLSREAMDRILRAVVEAGDTRVKLFAFEPVARKDGFGCVFHPSLRTHQAMARRLHAVVSKTMGW